YNGSTNVEISPKAGYGVSVVKVNSVEIDYTKLSYNEEENKYTYSLEGVTENTTISVEFAKIEKSAYQSPDVTDNFGDALNVIENDDYIEYVFKKGQTVTLETDKSGIRINGEATGFRFTTPEWSTQKTTEIEKIEIYSNEWVNPFKVKGWSEVELNKKTIKITFDENIDKDAVKLSVVPELNGYTVYNSDVNVTVNAKDSLSGIKSIDYFVTNEKIEDGKGYGDVVDDKKVQSGNLYTYNADVDDEVKTLLTKDILVSAEGEYVTVWVKLTDNANNSTFEKIEFSVDKTAPKVSVSIDGTPATTTTAGQGYYNKERTATITVIEPQGYSFNPTGLVIEITKSKKGEKTQTTTTIDSIIEKWKVDEQDKTKHTYKIEFEPDYTYTWKLISYSSNATKVESAQIEVDEESKTVWNFTVDNTKPTGELKYNFIPEIWETILEEITFGYFTNDKVTCSVNAKDEHSDIASIEYYKLVADSDLYNDILSDGQISEDDVKRMSFEEYPEDKFEITEEERFNVYAKITDLAGNVTYIGADGVIIDKTSLKIDIEPDELNGTGYYNGNFKVNVKVAEQGREDIQSGIKSIDYKICVDGEEKVKENIYTKGENIDYSCEKDIEVSAANCNGNDVKFIVTAVDNAGNDFEKTVTLAPIDTVFRNDDIKVTFNGNTGLKEDYYTDLKATIEIKEKNFDSDKVKVLIGATDAAGKTIDDSYAISQWTSNPNGDIHTATVTFNKDADYTFAIEATDKAGNDASFIEVKFTVDKTAPTGSVIVEGSVWEQINDTIRFEFGNTSRKVTAEDVKDTTTKTENIKIEYYISDEDVFLTDEALEELEGEEWKPFPDNGITKDPDSQFVVYLKLTDKVGNYSFIWSNGHILDEKVSEVKFETSDPSGTNDEGNSFYNGNVSVTAKVTDKINDQDVSSGIKKISAVVIKDGEETEKFEPYMFEGETTKENIKLSISKDYNFEVDAEKNNSCNVIAHVTVKDNAGNEKTYDLPLDIDITPPKVVVDFSDTKKDDAKENCFTSRTATV
ncbi:MAG: Ig-like domain repeat protein, partial [Clostridia bacterium]|nr:Ig-like domain repeat protein [Clostridia bacterium]